MDEFLSRPSDALIKTVAGWQGPFLVLGAGGKMGLHLCVTLSRALQAAGKRERVVAVSRFSTLRGREEFAAFGVETIACDLSDPEALGALPEAAGVFFLAGVKFGTKTAPQLLTQMNVEMPRLVAGRYRNSRIVAFSTGCVYPFVAPESGGATEELPVSRDFGAYAASCVEREVAFADAASTHGTKVALIRLNYSVEFRYGLLVDIAQRIWRGEAVDVTTGHVNVIWQPDAIDHSLRALDLAGSPAVPLNVTGHQILSVRQLAQKIGRLLEKPVRFSGLEASTAWLNNAARSHRQFGLPRTTVAEMLRWIAAWQREGGDTWGKPTGFERRDGQF